MGAAAQGRMTAHQPKKLDATACSPSATASRCRCPTTTASLASTARRGQRRDAYLRERRAELGGYLPARRSDCAPWRCRALEANSAFALEADGKEMSTTMAVVRMLGNLLKDPTLGKRVVPIVADEARTFGMATCSARSASTRPSASSTSPRTRTRC